MIDSLIVPIISISTSTSADRPMQTQLIQQTIGVPVFPPVRKTISDEPTLGLDLIHLLDRTTTGLSLSGINVHKDTPQAALGELRRLSGLTWEQLARLFDTSRRSLHFWASGQPISSSNEERLHRLLGTLRYINRGNASINRQILISPWKNGQIPFDLLVVGQYEDVKKMLGYGNSPEQVKLPPLDKNEHIARKPQKPEELIDAIQEPIIQKNISRSRSIKPTKVRKRDRKQ